MAKQAKGSNSSTNGGASTQKSSNRVGTNMGKNGKVSGKQNNRNRNRNGNGGVKREQPRKDSSAKRVNYDNAREDKVAEAIMRDANSGKFNDINDFLKNPILVQAAGSVPVAPIVGMKVGKLDPVPGIMVFPWVPNFGTFAPGGTRKYDIGGVETPFSLPPFAINQAADTTYSFLVHANSRNYSYNSADLFILIMAGSQVFAAIECMKRAYGLVKRYVEHNTYMPDSLLRAMGFDPEDMRRNFSRMWFDINLLITQSRQIWIPTTFPFVSRWIDMNSEVYKDAEGQYAQMYLFVQNVFYRYSEVGSKTGGCLVPAKYSYTTAAGVVDEGTIRPGTTVNNNYMVWTWEQWMSMIQNMIGHLVNSEDRGIIYGDLLNAYGAERILALPEIAADYAIEPVYTPEISMQIENMLGYSGKLPDYWGQIENRIVPMYANVPTGSVSITNGGMANWCLNFHTTTQPTPEMFLLATRFQTLGLRAAVVPILDTDTGEITSGKMWIPEAAGSEIIGEIQMIVEPLRTSATEGVYTIRQVSSTSNWYDQYIQTFDWHPFKSAQVTGSVSVPTQDQADTGAHLTAQIANAGTLFGDFDMYAEMQWEMLQRIDDVAFLSLFDVPSSIA